MDDLISRQAAIDSVRAGVLSTATLYGRTEEGETARKEIERTIKALPSANPQVSREDIHREREQAYMKGYEDASKRYRTEPCEDAISRQAVLDLIADYDLSMGQVVRGIHALPSVSTEKTGRWYLYEMFANGETILECSVCHNKHDKPWNYCPSCGARMVEPQESEDKE